jgi:hypothetical protein
MVSFVRGVSLLGELYRLHNNDKMLGAKGLFIIRPATCHQFNFSLTSYADYDHRRDQ